MAFAALAITRAQAQGVDVSSTTRLESVMASIRARDAKVGPVLAARFDAETEPSIRSWIVRGEAALKAPEGPTVFAKALRDPFAQVRSAAAEALAQTQGDQAAPALIAALAGESNSGVRYTIAYWLGTMKAPAAQATLQQSIASDVDANVRIQAVRSLKQRGGSAGRGAAAAARKDKDAGVRAVADEP